MTVAEPGVLLPRLRSALAGLPALRDPLLRNGHLLTLSSAMTSVVGLAYWAVAARRFDTADVGRNSAALSAMMLLGGLSQLNLMSAVVRFVPTAGRRTKSLVLGAYAVSVVVALAMASVFVLTLNRLAPRLQPLIHGPRMMALFVASSMGWCVFVLQDSVLTGLRKPGWVAGENTLFSVIKVALVVVLAGALRRQGIFVSWSIALVVSLIVTNGYLFIRAIPRHQASGAGGSTHGLGEIVRFAAVDYVGALLWILATTVVPILIINEVGATASAYFSIAWLMASSLYFVSANMGVSLVVETAADQVELATRVREVVRHSAKVILTGVWVLLIGARYFLRLFGDDYSEHGAPLLRLLTLSALPNIVTASAVSACRAQRRTGAAVVILACLCGSVLVISVVLLPRVGIVGVGYAWLISQSVVAGGLMAAPHRWLPPGIASL